MSPQEQEMFFFISDISGYTNYMLKNRLDYDHGGLIIKQLMDALIQEIHLPLKISKLEGDAIFIYLIKEQLSEEYNMNPKDLLQRILHFFDVFSAQLIAMQDLSHCPCGACINIDQLNLKMIVHEGKARIEKMALFEEVSGVDVIIAHRLLKNQLKEKQYLLLTEPAFKALNLPIEMRCVKMQQEDKDLGSIAIYVYFPKKNEPTIAPKERQKLLIKTFLKMSLGKVLIKLHLNKPLHYRNFPS